MLPRPVLQFFTYNKTPGIPSKATSVDLMTPSCLSTELVLEPSHHSTEFGEAVQKMGVIHTEVIDKVGYSSKDHDFCF